MVKHGFKLLMLILCLFAPCCIFGAEAIQDTINYQWGVQLNEEQIKGCPYSAQFVFESLPELGKTTTVDVKFQAHQFCYQEPQLRIIRMWTNGEDRGGFECSEVEPKWTPPIKKDDFYEGKFSFKTEKPGQYVLAVNVTTSKACVQNAEQIFQIFLNFDQSGKLVSLHGKEASPGNEPLVLKFEDGQVTNYIRFNTPLSLNDTTLILYYITIKDAIPQGLNISTTGSAGINLIPSSMKSSGSSGTGYYYKGGFKLVPTSTGDAYFMLRVEEIPQDGKIAIGAREFKVIFNLDENGKLRFIDKDTVSINR
ncbi:MAG TPA: hypothetical protein VMT04_01025 [Terriglobales bacterium]|nr:hypothetical protein [Terriglobales bacterium]